MFFSANTVLHHFFVCSLKDLGPQLFATGQFALEFEEVGLFKYVFIRFWKEDSIVKAFVFRYGLQSPPLADEMGALSRVLSAVSTRPQLVAVSRCADDFVQTVDNSGVFQHTLQSPFRLESVNLQSIMHKDSRSVFSRIDFFSVLQAIIVSLGGSLSLSWTLDCPELSNVLFWVFLGLLFSTYRS